MPPSARILQLAAATTLVFTFAYFLLTPSSVHQPLNVTRWQKTAPLEQAANLTLDVEILKQLNVPQNFKFQRHCINAREQDGLTRTSLVDIPQPLFSDGKFKEILLDENFQPDPQYMAIMPPCDSAIEINVPEFQSHADGNTRSLMLGVATTMKRIEESLPTFSRWLSNTGSPLVVLLVDQTDLKKVDLDISRTNTQAEALGIELIFEPYHHTFQADSEGLKNFGLATVLDKNRREETQWFGIIDDDTFFLSLRRMVENLGRYDHHYPWYIGALTEGHTRVAKEGFKAWGGAGFFISPPLMRTLADNAVECTRLDKFFGDLLWRDCIQEVTSPTVQLTEMRGLNQIDLWKDLSGWYEAGFNPILTVHHWKSWHFYPVAVGHIVADVAGPDAFLQRYRFGNHTVLTNGFSIAEYPFGLPDLNLVELTMTEDVNVNRPPEQLEFHHSFGHTRPKMELGRDKIQWKFEHAVKTSAGVVRQFYTKKENHDIDVSIIEIDWRHVG
ncbi:hypothetical protein CBER1_01064 [Cercospora berteroae]|uniref:Glycosyltransferase family 31 protein n=1 Tax=Cercospora berteroae TaxID=357750 RepID=A0A2S6C392_9PEZI|nr:hypothetical protein CBER1_01064 [Cercospora berteroae]